MSDKRNVPPSRELPSGSVRPTWSIVFWRELRDLWVGGKALTLILMYSVLLGIYSYMLAANAEVNLLPLREMILEMVKASIAVGAFICLIIAADSFSGERERGTLETMLLTPASRRQIGVGKFLAAVSPWPVALAIAIPYWAVLSKGDPVFGQALLWGSVLGSLLAPAMAGLGMLVSFWSNSNRTSLFVSLTLYLLFLLPALLPGRAQKGLVGKFFQRSNPLAAADEFLEKILVNNRAVHDFSSWLKGPVVFPIIVIALLFLYAAPRLRLQAGGGSLIRRHWRRVARPSTSR